MSQESQHTHFEDKIQEQVRLWGFPPTCASLSLVNDWWNMPSLKLVLCRYFWKIIHLPLLMLISFSGIFSLRSLLSLGDNLQRKRKKEAWWREYINLAEAFKKRSLKSEVKYFSFSLKADRIRLIWKQTKYILLALWDACEILKRLGRLGHWTLVYVGPATLGLS